MEGGICYLQPPDSKSTLRNSGPCWYHMDMLPTDFHLSLHMNNFPLYQVRKFKDLHTASTLNLRYKLSEVNFMDLRTNVLLQL